MKMLATLLFTLLSFTSHAQSTWPRNPRTGEVELQGSLPWPRDAKTDSQQQALVRRWYLAKLTDLSPAEVDRKAAPDKTSSILTYARLPKVAVLRQGKGSNEYILGYTMRLTGSPIGLAYTVNDFYFNKVSEVESYDPTPLEELLPKATPKEQAALAALRKRLAVALAGW
ncbi:MAG: hypothetical protein ACRYFZ_01680 [Janthinobacterium lividum]